MTVDQRPDLLKLYELASGEERNQFEQYQKSIAFHFGIVAALLGATVAGALRASQWHHFLLLTVGPLLVAIAAKIGIEGTTRLYLGWLERITIRAKLEDRLELTKPPADGAALCYWRSEAIIAARNLQDRSSTQSSKDFVDQRLHRGYHLWARRLFLGFLVLAVLLFAGLVALAAFLYSGVVGPCINGGV